MRHPWEVLVFVFHFPQSCLLQNGTNGPLLGFLAPEPFFCKPVQMGCWFLLVNFPQSRFFIQNWCLLYIFPRAAFNQEKTTTGVKKIKEALQDLPWPEVAAVEVDLAKALVEVRLLEDR